MNYLSVPVYQASRNQAKQDRELQTWKQSHDANVACARAINHIISKGRSEDGIDNKAVKDVIDRFGHERVRLVLAVAEKTADDRQLSDKNLTWANRMKTNHITKTEAKEFAVRAPAPLLDVFTTQAREAWEALNFYDHSHCSAGYDSDVNFTGQILVLNPTLLNHNEKQSEKQLVRADTGFGCKPGSLGKIFGTFLLDGSKESFRRSDFLGVLAPEHLPQWAREQINELDQNRRDQEPTMNL